MTERGYRRRLACVEWHANLWASCGVPRSVCEAMLAACSESVDADFYGVERPTLAPALQPIQAYFDREFQSLSVGPCGLFSDYFA